MIQKARLVLKLDCAKLKMVSVQGQVSNLYPNLLQINYLFKTFLKESYI